MIIAVIGMLDEREESLQLIKDHIEGRGHKTILIDISIGTGAITSALKADVNCEEIAGISETTVDNIRNMLARETPLDTIRNR